MDNSATHMDDNTNTPAPDASVQQPPAADASVEQHAAPATVEQNEVVLPQEQAPFPVPFLAYAAILARTDRAVYTVLLKQRHGLEKHTREEWDKILDNMSKEPA